MLYLHQTKFCSPDETVHGNCFATSIACLLDRQIEEIPSFEEMGVEWNDRFMEFLYEKGYSYEGTYNLIGDEKWATTEILGPGMAGNFIVGGSSPRGVSAGHCCIYNSVGKMIHDPHPSGDGLVKIWEVYLIEKAIIR